MPFEDQSQLATLLGLALRGDLKAQDILLARLRPYLGLMVRRWHMPGLQHKFGDSDLVQETLVRIYRGLDATHRDDEGRFRGQEVPQFLGWVAKIVHNVVADNLRYDRAERRDERRELPGSGIFALLSQGSNPEQRAVRQERAVLLATALERLPLHQRDVLQSRFFDQLSFKEISERTGKSDGALRVLCSRALRSLAQDEQLRREMETES